LLAIRYNGLETGIYLYSALLNHSDQPNCVKFLPDDTNNLNSGHCVSEVRTTRTVQQGEALTISYVPRILSHVSRRKHLWEQHRFDIGPDIVQGNNTHRDDNGDNRRKDLRRMELIGNQFPRSALHKWDEDSITHRIERTIVELESIYHEASLPRSDAHARSEQAKALEQASLELCLEAEAQLQNKNHILLLPCCRLHVDSCDLVQRDASLSHVDRLILLGRMVVSAKRLLGLQTMLLGPDHFDIARTELDLAQAVEELLVRSPKHLIALKLEGLQTESAWATLEYRSKKNHDRIKALYPRDAHEYVLKYQYDAS
jgi:SET domain